TLLTQIIKMSRSAHSISTHSHQYPSSLEDFFDAPECPMSAPSSEDYL
ncbi:hypothetical protein A2U01_0027590, partial [Trifolium medium]|nr:hypothetical protein [Trifolium medium]